MSRKGRRGYEDDDDRDVEKGRNQKVKSTAESSGGESDSSFLFDKQTRKDFVAKVYAILTLQLAITFAIIFILNYVELIREFMADYFWIGYIFLGIQVIFYCAIVCSESVRKSYPANFILLTIHTFFFAGFGAWISAKYELNVIWLAFMVTAIVTLLVTVIAKYSPWDVTGCWLFFLIAFLAMTIFSLIAFIMSFFMSVHLLYTIISGIMVGLLSFYLMFMTQMILGGRKGQIEPDEVVFAVIILYVTIMDIFIHLLRLIGACMGED